MHNIGPRALPRRTPLSPHDAMARPGCVTGARTGPADPAAAGPITM